MSTLYAAFPEPGSAEKAIGALLDNGAVQSSISLIASHPGPDNLAETDAIESAAKSGISTTTGADAAAGALKGTAVGIGVGIAALVATLFIPGIGLIVGGGALATALAGVAGTTLAGTAVGTVTGFLVDQGLNEDQATVYSTALASGGALVAISVPTGKLTDAEVEGILNKYGALNVATYNSATAQDSIPISEPTQALVMHRVDPVLVVTESAAVPTSPTVTRQVTTTENKITGEVRETETISRQDPAEVKTVFDPLTGTQHEEVTQHAPVIVQNERITMSGEHPAESLFTPAATETVVDPITGQPMVRVTKDVALDDITGLPILEELNRNKPYAG